VLYYGHEIGLRRKNMKLHKKVASWLIDYGYMVRGAAGSVLNSRAPGHYLEHTIAGKVPVIIIPGVLGKWSFMKSLADNISLQGHPVYILPKLGYNLYNIPASAEVLRQAVEEMNEAEKIILVAHSKGGLIGKYFLAHHNAKNKVAALIAIATPFSGSSMAKFVPLDPVRELHTDSQIIQDLLSHTVVNKKIVSIIPEYDNHVWAEQGSFLEGADNREVVVHGHHRVVFDKGVQKVVFDSIEKITAAL
jgi:pimeloyl-ACP methyl ester carboxylesterase